MQRSRKRSRRSRKRSSRRRSRSRRRTTRPVYFDLAFGRRRKNRDRKYRGRSMTRRMKSKQKLKKRSGSRFIVVRPSSASVMNLPPINVREDKIMQEALGYSDLATLLVI